MTSRHSRSGGRSAFTLIELLVVISIIAILVSLTAAAVVRILLKGPEIQTNSDINLLATKLPTVPNAHFLPSRLHLSKLNNYGNTPLDKDSKSFLQDRFGRKVCCDFTPLPNANYPSVQFIDWNGDGNQNEELFLEGEQCLVFHLGGIPQKGANGAITMTGFSANIQNPAQPPQPGETRQGPYMELQSGRLLMVSSSFPGNTGQFPVYLDAWKATPPLPYAYFSSYGAAGGGNYLKYGGSDCPSLGVSPFIQQSAPTMVFANANSFQIISAGRDGKFGAGGANWNPASGTTDPNGKDDQSNFSTRLLGAPAN